MRKLHTITLGLIAIAMIGCEQASVDAPAEWNADRTQDWRLLVQGRAGIPVALVSLINKSSPSGRAYRPDEFVSLDVEPVPPLRATGHLVQSVIFDTEVVPKGHSRSATFRLEDRIDASSAADGTYACRMIYDDSWVPKERLSAKSTVGRIYSRPFMLRIQDKRVAGIESIGNIDADYSADILLANVALFDQCPDTSGFEKTTWNPHALNVYKSYFGELNLLTFDELRRVVEHVENRRQGILSSKTHDKEKVKMYLEDTKKLHLLNRLVFDLPRLAPKDSPTFWRLTYYHSPSGGVDYMYPFAYSREGVIVLKARTLSYDGTGVDRTPLEEFNHFAKEFDRRGEVEIRPEDATIGPGGPSSLSD